MLKLWRSVTYSLPALLIYTLNITVFSAIALVLFYDIENYYDHKSKYYGYNFSSFRKAMLSLFALQTKDNHPGIWLKIYNANKIVSMFFAVYALWTIYLVVNIVVSIVYITYKKYYAEIIENLPNKFDYSRILAASYNEKNQMVMLDEMKVMCREYIEKGADHLDFIMAKHFQRRFNKTILDPIPKPSEFRNTGCKTL